jgi:hypothetical protein
MAFLPRRTEFATLVFLLTVAIARLNSNVIPRFGVSMSGIHIHHYVFGIFILTAAGYLALAFKGPRATFLIALFYGLGVGLTFDEFGFWIHPSFIYGYGVRANTTGLLIVACLFTAICAINIAVKRRAGFLESWKGLARYPETVGDQAARSVVASGDE